MKFYQVLDDLLGQHSKVKILRYLCQTRLEMSGRRIAKDLGLSPWACHLALRQLTDQGVLTMRNVGRTCLFCLNEGNYVAAKLLLPLFTGEAHLLQNAIEELTAGLDKSIISVILYGSVARKQEHPFSDLDLVVLVPSDASRKKVRALFESSEESFIARFGNRLSPLILPVAEFRKRYRNRDPLIMDVVNTGRVVSGQLITEVIRHGAQKDS